MQISDLGLSAKAYDALKRCGVKTVEDILNLPKTRLMMQPRVGAVTVRKIEFALRRLGLEWIDKAVDEPPITLRDKFAMAAMGSMTLQWKDFEDLASLAYQLADAMIAERRK